MGNKSPAPAPKSVDAVNTDGPKLKTRSKSMSILRRKTNPATVEKKIENPIFGVPLNTAIRHSPDFAEDQSLRNFVPIVVRRCCEYLNIKGVDEEGLYRIPGNKKNIEMYCARFNTGESVDFIQESMKHYVDPHDIAGLLLLFFKVLPEGVFTDSLHSSFVNQTFKELSIEQKVAKLRGLLDLLPKQNKETIRVLMEHFFKVKQNSKRNQMTTKNLVLCVYGTSPYSPVFFNLIENFEFVYLATQAIAPVENPTPISSLPPVQTSSPTQATQSQEPQPQQQPIPESQPVPVVQPISNAQPEPEPLPVQVPTTPTKDNSPEAVVFDQIVSSPADDGNNNHDTSIASPIVEHHRRASDSDLVVQHHHSE